MEPIDVVSEFNKGTSVYIFQVTEYKELHLIYIRKDNTYKIIGFNYSSLITKERSIKSTKQIKLYDAAVLFCILCKSEENFDYFLNKYKKV